MTERITEKCPEWSINGVDLIAWVHPNEFPFNGYTNTTEVCDRLQPTDSHPLAVAVDGFNSGQWKLFLDPTNLSTDLEDQTFLRRGFIDTENILLAGDFKTASALSEIETSQELKKLTFAGLVAAGGIGLALSGRRRKVTDEGTEGMSRRGFLTAAGKALIGGVAAFTIFRTSMNLTQQITVDAINTCDPDNPSLRVLELLNDPESSDMIYRNGLSLAKQVRMTETGFLRNHGIDVSGNKSVWGMSHLYPEMLEPTKTVAANPAFYADHLIGRERDIFLQKGLGVLDITDRIAQLRFSMATILPFKVVETDGFPQFTLPLGEFFFDDRILGFDARGMDAQQISSRMYKTSFDITMSSPLLNT